MKANGLKDAELVFESDALLNIVRLYTSEAGVRGLERQIAKVCRKVVKEQTAQKKHESHCDRRRFRALLRCAKVHLWLG